MSDFTATINEGSERAAAWTAVFGGRVVPLVSPFPHEASAPGIAAAWFYQIDVTAITPGQRARLVAHIASRFDIPEAEVDAALDTVGCPVLAEDVTVVVANPQKWI